MEESTKIISIVVAILVVVIIVGIVMGITAFGNSAKDSAMDDLAAGMGQMDQSKFDKFDNGMLSGSQIAAALTEFKGTPVILSLKLRAALNVIILLGTAAQPHPRPIPLTVYPPTLARILMLPDQHWTWPGILPKVITWIFGLQKTRRAQTLLSSLANLTVSLSRMKMIRQLVYIASSVRNGYTAPSRKRGRTCFSSGSI